jgi:hypothetical protein
MAVADSARWDVIPAYSPRVMPDTDLAADRCRSDAGTGAVAAKWLGGALGVGAGTLGAPDRRAATAGEAHRQRPAHGEQQHVARSERAEVVLHAGGHADPGDDDRELAAGDQ